MGISERKNNRGRIQIMGDVLGLATSGIKKTHIMYRANLSYEQVHMYLAELIEKGLLAQSAGDEGVVYRTTERGREYLHYYGRLVGLLEEGGDGRPAQSGVSMPYVVR
ncbi:winged helix-turn-helix domain-containing protein [Nitrososphaera sp.]|uniref:winged helix-turn-helix domain-containing protein n=1 Tax=Nitrososphaera sp. TaxID=1971748 RepID=UPI00307FAA31